MKTHIKFLSILALIFGIFSCTPEEVDIAALTDFPPGILSISPSDNSRVASGNFDLIGKFVSGTASPLASASITLKDASGKEITKASKNITGTTDSLVIKGSVFKSNELPLGKYSLEVTVTDTKGKSQKKTNAFEIYNLPDVGIIGSGTAKGWGEDTDMTHIGNGVFEIVIALVDGEVKFRANNAWTVNWGADGFPTGVGKQDGPNIKVTAGTWKVRFEPGSGAYSFSPAVTFKSNAKELYLLGTFNTFQGSGYKFNLVSDNTWVLKEAQLKPSDKFKFAEGPSFMGKNWGDNNSDGTAEEFGANITLSNLPANKGEAFYKITFNDKNLKYTVEFVKFPTIGIIGSATPGGWDKETAMKDNGDGSFSVLITLKDGEAKFRANNSWDTNWGAAAFPKGVGTQNGPNIPVKAGTYNVVFKPGTGEYEFKVGIERMGIIGSATPGGWGEDTKMSDNGDGTYSVVLGLVAGEAKFRINSSWDTNWGAKGFPNGTGTLGGDNIPVPAGLYTITINPSTGAYKFENASIGIIGSATPGGWNTDTNMSIADPAKPNLLTLTLDLVAGEAKFRANDDWKFNWGAKGFPTGKGTPGGDNIPIPAGRYKVTFDVNTGDYSFN